jgi:hypothetical protein
MCSWDIVSIRVFKKFKIVLLQINFFDFLDVLIYKIKKYIILMHFHIKNILKSNRYHYLKHPKKILYKQDIKNGEVLCPFGIEVEVIFCLHLLLM